eukprot:PITA_13529
MDDFRGDPFEWLCADVFALVLSLLDVVSLARSVSICTKWKSVDESDILWATHCLELLRDKFTVRTTSMHQIEPRITAYCLSLEEGRRVNSSTLVTIFISRTRSHSLKTQIYNGTDDTNHGRRSVLIHLEFLVQEGNRKNDTLAEKNLLQEAGNHWVKCDGYVSSDPDDPLSGVHERRWNFTKMYEERSVMACVRLNEWPPLQVSRTSCWGWRMENFMVVYETSYPRESSQPAVAVDDQRKF